VALVALACVAATATLWPAATHADEATDQNQIKANMLWNIAKFVRWPDGAFDKTRGQLVFTILGEDPLAEALAVTLSTKTINGRPVFVHFARRPQDAAGCQILYIAASEHGRMGEVLRAIDGSWMLTVADTSGFVVRGGMVDFALELDKVRFEINQARAEKAGLKISAKLLALAHVVEVTP
jgi:hypothetical protein